MIRALDEKTFVSGQIDPAALPQLKQLGVTMLVNNRPDGEDPGQPTSAEMKRAAEEAVIAYRHVPIARGIGPADAEAMAEAMDSAGDGRMLAYCRVGMRSALAWALARRAQGASRDEIEQALEQAGFDPGPIAHLL